jgi:hypothetical protein
MKFIYADFMKMDDEGRLVLTCLGTYKDLENYNISLENGLKLVFYNDDQDENGNRDDLVVDGTVEYDQKNQRWVANINWDDIKNISRLSSEEKQKLGI